MLNHVPLIICDDANSDDAALISAISEKWGFPVISSSEKPSEGLYLQVQNGVLGLATVGVVCNQSFAYAMVESRWTSNLTFRTAVTVHELGHNFNAGHCDQISGCSSQPCRIMCSSAGG